MGQEERLAGLILVAGFSSRAPGFKPLLPLGDKLVIERTVACLQRAGIRDITAVIGYRAEELLPVLARLSVRPVRNERYAEGMFSSVVSGVKALSSEMDAFFLLPADMPLVCSHTIKLLARAYIKTGADVIYPVFRSQRGHPTLISTRLSSTILAYDGEGGLRQLLRQYESRACEVDVVDEGVVMDLDLPQDYLNMLERISRRHVPAPNECFAILATLGVPEKTVRHGRVVAEIARKMAGCLNEKGAKLDIELVTTAGLLHDLAKGKPSHAIFGAKVMKGLGYPKVAEIVAVHTDLPLSQNVLLNEAAIVYLADKLVAHERVVSLTERFQCVAERYAAETGALEAIKRRKAIAQIIQSLIEKELGMNLDKVIGGEDQALQLIAGR